MANLSFSVASSASQQLRSLLPRIQNPVPLYKSWANYLEGRAIAAFKSETSPAGQRWAVLSTRYAQYKESFGGNSSKSKKRRKASGKPRPKGSGKLILRWSGTLYDSIAATVLPDGAAVGSNQAVGGYSLLAIHQFGAPARNIPARPVLPLDEQGNVLPQDVQALTKLGQDWLQIEVLRDTNF